MSNNPNFSHSNSESFQDQDVLNDSEIPPFDPDAAIARREAVWQEQEQVNNNQTPEEPQSTEELQPTEESEKETPEDEEREWRARRIESLVAAIEDQIKSTERRVDDAKQDLQHLQAIIEEELSTRDKADTNMLRSYNRRYSDYNDELNLVSRRLNELADDLLVACSHGREDLEPQRFEDLRRRGFSLLDQSEEVKKSFRQNLDYFDDTSRRIRQLEQLIHGW